MKTQHVFNCLTLGFVTMGASFQARADLPLGKVPPLVELSGDRGARVDNGEPWRSDLYKGKLHTIWYVAPDEKDLNEDAAQALKAQNFPPDKAPSVAVINMAASWAPNFIIQSALKQKQEEFPNTLYVRDFGRHLVKEWGLKDNSSDVVAVDKTGKVLFSKDGKLSEQDIKDLIKILWANI